MINVSFLLPLLQITTYFVASPTQIYCFVALEVGRLKSFSVGSNQSIGRAVLLLKPLGDKLFLCLFQLPAFLGWWPYIPPTFVSTIILLPLPLLSPSPTHLSPSYKDPCDYIEPTQIIQDNLSIS